MGMHLYLLCEGETDELFYERLAERITGKTFTPDDEFRYRVGANWKTVFSHAKLLLDRVKQWSSKQDVAVIIATDNDRAPDHPGGVTSPRPLPAFDLKKQPRYQALQNLLRDKLGQAVENWPVNVAVAVPVEMIESWLLLLLEPDLTELPQFPEANAAAARAYYGGTPPQQLKDIRDAIRQQRGVSLDTLFWEAADQGDLDHLAARSKSFAMFEAELRTWK